MCHIFFVSNSVEDTGVTVGGVEAGEVYCVCYYSFLYLFIFWGGGGGGGEGGKEEG